MKDYVINKPITFGCFVVIAYLAICVCTQVLPSLVGIMLAFMFAIVFHAGVLSMKILHLLTNKDIPKYGKELDLMELQYISSILNEYDIDNKLDEDISKYIKKQNQKGSSEFDEE